MTSLICVYAQLDDEHDIRSRTPEIEAVLDV